MPNDVSSRRARPRVELQLFEHSEEDRLMVLRLLQVFRPLVAQVRVDRGSNRAFIHLLSAELGFERLIEKFSDLFDIVGCAFHGLPLANDSASVVPPLRAHTCGRAAGPAWRLHTPSARCSVNSSSTCFSSESKR